MKRILAFALVSVGLLANNGSCSGGVNSASAITRIVAENTIMQLEMLQQYRLDTHKITQQQFDEFKARANLLRSSANLTAMTVAQIQAALRGEPDTIP